VNHLALGFTMEDVVGQSFLKFNPDHSKARLQQALDHVLKTGTQDSFETVGQGPHGRDTHYLTRMSPVMEDGHVVSAVLVATDLTALKEGEAALRRSEHTQKLALSAAGAGIWDWNVLDAQQTHWDARCCEIFGLPPGTRAPAPEAMMALIHPEDRARVTAAMELGVRTGQYHLMDHRLLRPDGTVRWVRASGIAERDSNGETRRLVGTIRDITEQRALEEQLFQAQKMESVGRLAGGIAHDFNNMLTAILSSLELAQEALPKDHPVRSDILEAQRAAERSATLTAQLLTFARRQLLQPRVTQVTALVETVRSLLVRLLGESITLETHTTAQGEVLVDPTRMEQVLVNLAVNARDAMPQGGHLRLETQDVTLDANACARLEGLTPGPHVLLTVQDTGLGMDQTVLPHIFEPYFSTKTRGNGLGLATSFGIIKQHQGHIAVQSTPGQGATFFVYLPHTSQRAAPEPVPPVPTVMATHHTLLLVEDEELVRRPTVRALQALGYKVLEAPGPREALELLRQWQAPLDLLVTDMVMPGGNGLDLSHAARQLRPGLPVLLVSGHISDDTTLDTLRQRNVDFLGKPYLPAELAARIQAILGRAAAPAVQPSTTRRT
jgi:two-component system cell cycle sensor histidine kinase/response regulator CckA